MVCESRRCFLFTRKTAYEMGVGLVGSDICIRDSFGSLAPGVHGPEHAQECCACTRDLLCIHKRFFCVYTTMRNYAKLCETMRNYAKLCETKRFSQICRKLDAQFRANVSICTRLRIESSLPEFASGASGARGARGNRVTESCSDPPSPRAGG